MLLNDAENLYTDGHSKFPFDSKDYKLDFIHPLSHQISGKLLGNFLSIITQVLQPRRVLEIGTMIGYSTICMAMQLPEEGLLHTIEIREKDLNTAKNNFKKYKVDNKIISHLGNALDIIPKFNEQWDMVFIDADKVNYINYYNMSLEKLKKNGIIIVDNVLFHNRVVNENDNSKNVKAIREFNKFVIDDLRVNNLLINIRDGIQLITKK